MRWRPGRAGGLRRAALGAAAVAPLALPAVRWRARGWDAEEAESPPALTPERWAELRSLGERAALMPKGRIDLQGIRRWHFEHGFRGAITLREWPANCAEHVGCASGTMSRGRGECYYVYYELTAQGKFVQQIFIRGTCVPEDFLENILVAKVWDVELGCHLHHGFRRRAEQVLASVEPLLDPAAEITLSGHSLGGAVATIVGMRLEARGYNVREVVTFGAPKVTDRAAARCHAFRNRVLRVASLLDPVPLLPFGFCTPFSGPFAQLGAQLLLLPPSGPGPPAFAHLGPEAAAAPWVASFLLHAQPPRRGSLGWLDHHRMWSYSRLLEPFAEAPHVARQVPFDRRHAPPRDAAAAQ